jgi:hypothetical protein
MTMQEKNEINYKLLLMKIILSTGRAIFIRSQVNVTQPGSKVHGFG